MKQKLIGLLVLAVSVGVVSAAPYGSSKSEVATMSHAEPQGKTKIAGPAIQLDGVGRKLAEGPNTHDAQDEGGLGQKMQMATVLDKFKNDYTVENGNRVWNIKGDMVKGKFTGGLTFFIPNWVKKIHAGLMMPNSHLTIGRVDDVVVPDYTNPGNDDGIYFGAFHREPGSEFGQNFTKTIDAVFYGGDNATADLVGLSGTATYAVTGIAHDVGDSARISTGTFTADFGTKQLTGSLTGGGKILDIGTAAIANNASFSGSGATLTGESTAGKVTGQFYDYAGVKAGALAGQAKFGTAGAAGIAGADTAFGGKQ